MTVAKKFVKAANLITDAERTVVFTGAGISVESGVPPFRGKGGIWNKYDPQLFSLQYFKSNPEQAWQLCEEVFFNIFGKVSPNLAHNIIAAWEKEGLIQAVITQNIDGLHQKAGNEEIYRFHGTAQELVCLNCGSVFNFKKEYLQELPPHCSSCGGLLKPNFIFFGESIPQKAAHNSFREVEEADLLLVIGTTGAVMPASLLPQTAAKNGANIIEINTEESNYTTGITDIFLQGKATKMMEELDNIIRGDRR